MKKALLLALFTGLLIFPTFSYAQTGTDPVTVDQLKAQLADLVTQLKIAELMQQLADLQAQLQVMLANQVSIQTSQATTAAKVDTIVQNTTPVQTFGATTPAPVFVKTLNISEPDCKPSELKGLVCKIVVAYLENNSPKDAIISLSSDVTSDSIKLIDTNNINSTFDFIPSNSGVQTRITGTSADGSTNTVDFIARTFTASANGLTSTKSVTIQPYIYPPTTPTVTKISENTVLKKDYVGQIIGKIKITGIVGVFIDKIIADDNFSTSYEFSSQDLCHTNDTGGSCIFSNHVILEPSKSEMTIKSFNSLKPGIYTLSIKSINGFGGDTGSDITITNGLPITFTFEVK